MSGEVVDDLLVSLPLHGGVGLVEVVVLLFQIVPGILLDLDFLVVVVGDDDLVYFLLENASPLDVVGNDVFEEDVETLRRVLFIEELHSVRGDFHLQRRKSVELVVPREDLDGEVVVVRVGLLHLNFRGKHLVALNADHFIKLIISHAI